MSDSGRASECFLCGHEIVVLPFPHSLGMTGGYHVVVDGRAYLGDLCWDCYYPDGFWRAVEHKIRSGASQLELAL